jgi:hypothetical protein
VIIFENFSFALFTPPLGDFQAPAPAPVSESMHLQHESLMCQADLPAPDLFAELNALVLDALNIYQSAP